MRTLKHVAAGAGRAILAIGLLAVAFAPQVGMLELNAAGLIGLGLIGAGVCVHTHRCRHRPETG